MGCVFTLMALILIPFVIGIIAVFFGVLGASVLTAIISTIVFVILSKNGIFAKNCNSETDWKRVVAKISKALLIVVMVCSYIATIACAVILIWFVNGD